MNTKAGDEAAPYPDPAEAWQGAADLLGAYLHDTPQADLGTIMLYAHPAEHGVLPALAAAMVGDWAVMIVDKARFLDAMRASSSSRAAEIETASTPGEVTVYLFGANYHAVGAMHWTCTPLAPGGSA